MTQGIVGGVKVSELSGAANGVVTVVAAELRHAHVPGTPPSPVMIAPLLDDDELLAPAALDDELEPPAPLAVEPVVSVLPDPNPVDPTLEPAVPPFEPVEFAPADVFALDPPEGEPADVPPPEPNEDALLDAPLAALEAPAFELPVVVAGGDEPPLHATAPKKNVDTAPPISRATCCCRMDSAPSNLRTHRRVRPLRLPKLRAPSKGVGRGPTRPLAP